MELSNEQLIAEAIEIDHAAIKFLYRHFLTEERPDRPQPAARQEAPASTPIPKPAPTTNPPFGSRCFNRVLRRFIGTYGHAHGNQFLA